MPLRKGALYTVVRRPRGRAPGPPPDHAPPSACYLRWDVSGDGRGGCTTRETASFRPALGAPRWPTGSWKRPIARPSRTRDKAFIESLPFFFLATADADGRPDCSFKGGAPGFVRVVAPDLLVYPDYDGNGMFKSLGNIRSNPQVGLLFIAMTERPKRLRVLGTAELAFDDPLLASFPGGQVAGAGHARRTSSRTARATSPT